MGNIKEAPEAIPQDKARNLVLYGTDSQPEIVIPDRPSASIIKVPDLKDVPHVLDAIPRSDGRPYAIFEAPVITLPPVESEKTAEQVSGEDVPVVQAPEVQVPEKPTVEIVLVRFSDSTNAAQNLKQAERGMQRARMFGRLEELVLKARRRAKRGQVATQPLIYKDRNGENKVAPFKVTPRVFDVLQGTVISFFADELAKEPLTKELGKMEQKQAKTRASEDMLSGDVLEGADRVISDERIKKNGANVKFTDMENKTNNSTSREGGDTGNTEGKETVVFSTDDEGWKPWEKPRTLMGDVESFLKLDTPSKNAGAYVRELMNRPF